ncbi:MAG TPA: alpha/beta fold hydrolase [Verrucomicrobiae bacterium]|nr:alpha/beta fold hydrolase [Verrucomicrobiae bacterium]
MKDIPLLLIHGFPFDHAMWFSTIASLGANAKVLAPDLPGFGRNAILMQEDPSLEAMADFLIRFMDQNQMASAVIAGMSMGGYVALSLAENYPTRLAGLGLISSQTAADSDETRKGRFETIKKIRAAGPGVILDSLVPKLFAREKWKNPDLRGYPERGAKAAGVDGLCWALEAMAKRTDRTAMARSLNIPILVVHGMEDQIIPFAKARELAESCQKPILIELPGVGHSSPLEAPDPVASGLARLMTKCREQAGPGRSADSSDADPSLPQS